MSRGGDRVPDLALTSLGPEATDALATLVRIPSVSGDEAAAQAWMADRLRALDAELDVWEPSLAELRGHAAYSNIAERDTAGRPNVVARWRGTGGGRSLILNGHIDVVAPGAREGWHREPWSGVVEDGRLHGRGAVDMKAGLLAGLFAMTAIHRAGVRLRGDVLFESVIAEEEGGVGTLATLLRGHRADAALVLEPSHLTLATSAAGVALFRVIVEGKIAHGSRRTLGVSAFEKFLPLHAALRVLEAEVNSEVNDPLFAAYDTPLSLNIHRVEALGSGSSVPDRLVAEGRFGYLGTDAATARRRFEAALATAAADPWLRDHPPRVEWTPGVWDPVPAAPPELVGAFQTSFRGATGADVTLLPKIAGTDARILTHAGRLPTVVFGPGDPVMSHFPDESVSIDEYLTSIRAIAAFVLEWCGTA